MSPRRAVSRRSRGRALGVHLGGRRVHARGGRRRRELVRLLTVGGRRGHRRRRGGGRGRVVAPSGLRLGGTHGRWRASRAGRQRRARRERIALLRRATDLRAQRRLRSERVRHRRVLARGALVERTARGLVDPSLGNVEGRQKANEFRRRSSRIEQTQRLVLSRASHPRRGHATRSQTRPVPCPSPRPSRAIARTFPRPSRVAL